MFYFNGLQTRKFSQTSATARYLQQFNIGCIYNNSTLDELVKDIEIYISEQHRHELRFWIFMDKHPRDNRRSEWLLYTLFNALELIPKIKIKDLFDEMIAFHFKNRVYVVKYNLGEFRDSSTIESMTESEYIEHAMFWE